MSEIEYFRECWAGSAYRNEQFIPENRWKRVTGKYLHEPVLSVSTRLVNVSQFRKQVRAGCPRGQTCFLCASTLMQYCVGSTTSWPEAKMFVIENLIIFVMNFTAQVFIYFSIILAINGRSKIGLKLSVILWLFPLCKGSILANFKTAGKTPSVIAQLKISQIMGAIWLDSNLNMKTGILLTWEGLSLNVLINLITSGGVAGIGEKVSGIRSGNGSVSVGGIFSSSLSATVEKSHKIYLVHL